MLDLNITLLFQLVNFFIAIFVLNILLIRPIRDIIKKRNGVMDNLAGEADNFESQAAERLASYEAELARARQDAGRAGTGLGLSITKAILQQHGFAFGVNSAVGQGSTFWFEMRDTRHKK